MNKYFRNVKILQIGLIFSAMLAVTYLLSCGVSKPTEESLLDTFGEDVVNYGWNSLNYRVNYKLSDNVYTWTGFKRIAGKVWANNFATVTVLDVKIIENESDRFPYKGIVTNEKNAPNTGSATAEITYYYGKKTHKWVREETVTP